MGWHRHSPRVEEDLERNTVTVTLPLLSQIAPEVEQELRRIVGPQYALLPSLDRDILIQAYQLGEISNEALQFSLSDHPRDIGARLKFLCDQGWLTREGAAGRGRTYKFAPERTLDLFDEEGPSSGRGSGQGSREHLQDVAAQIRATKLVQRSDMEAVILELCRGRYLTPRELGALLGRDSFQLSKRFLKQMVSGGRLVRRYPASPSHPFQAYRAAGT